jgi:hypothetical protein
MKETVKVLKESEIHESVSFNIHLKTSVPRTSKKLTVESRTSFQRFIQAQKLCLQDDFLMLQDNLFCLEVNVEDVVTDVWDFNLMIYEDPEDNAYVLMVRWLANKDHIEQNMTMKRVQAIAVNAHTMLRRLKAWVQTEL